MHFRRVKQLGAGDVGLVDLVQLQGTEFKFAMKTLDKYEMQERNKVQRVLTEERILMSVDHPFLPTLYCTIQTETHLHFIMEFCDGGELYGLLNAQPKKRLKEAHVRFYVAEVLLALQYLHLLGFVYRDLKVSTAATKELCCNQHHDSRKCGPLQPSSMNARQERAAVLGSSSACC
jgi:serine/threonine protein kinase